MSEIEDKLNGMLEIKAEEEVEEEETPSEIIPAPNTLPVSAERDLEYDYENVRETQRDLLDQGSEAIEGILKVAKESQHPRAYEVAGNLLKIQSDIADKLITLHEKKRKLDGESYAGPTHATQINAEQAVFVGSTSDLLKQVRKREQENK